MKEHICGKCNKEIVGIRVSRDPYYCTTCWDAWTVLCSAAIDKLFKEWLNG